MVEGAELLSMALASGAPIESVYVAPEGRANPVGGRRGGAGVRHRRAGLRPGARASSSGSPTRSPPSRWWPWWGSSPAALDELRDASMVVVCVDVRDPGNAGTMIRTADAAGVDAVVCCDGTVDPTNPKTVRASAGSIFHTPVVVGGDAAAVIGTLRGWGMTAVGTEVRGGIDYSGFDWRQSGGPGLRQRGLGARAVGAPVSWTSGSRSPWSAGPSRST